MRMNCHHAEGIQQEIPMASTKGGAPRPPNGPSTTDEKSGKKRGNNPPKKPKK
jgi:hypothetical protein